MSRAINYFVEVPENPTPDGARIDVLDLANGLQIRTAAWLREGARGTVCLFPGRSEFIEKYFEVTGELLARGFSVAALDWRGQGGSSRELANARKGHIDDFDLYLRDLDAFFAHLERIDAPKPWFGLAHSMGGAILLLAASRGERRLKRLVLSAPMTGLAGMGASSTARLIVQLANIAGLGGLSVPGAGGKAPSGLTEFKNNLLTSDEGRYQRQTAIMIKGVEVTLGAPTIGWLAAAFRLIGAMRNPDFGLAMTMPMLIFAAGADRIVSSTSVESVASRLRGAQCLTLVGAQHEILMERDSIRAQFWAAFDAFVPGSG